MKTHVIIQYERVQNDKNDPDSEEDGECPSLPPREEDDVGDKSKHARPEDRYLRSDEESEKSDADCSDDNLNTSRKCFEEEGEENENDRDVEPAHGDDMGESGIVEVLFGVRGEFRPFSNENATEEIRAFSGIDGNDASEDFLANRPKYDGDY